MDFYDKDPKKGGLRISPWKFIEKSGMVQRFREHGVIINPTHDFEKLKVVRLNLFEEKKKEFLAERALNDLATVESDLDLLKLTWLKNEIEVIRKWASDTEPNGEKKRLLPSYSECVELTKYEAFIHSEIELLNQKSRITKRKKADDEIEFFMLYKGNVEIFSQIKAIVKGEGTLDNATFHDNGTPDDAYTYVANELFKTVFIEPLEAVFLFSDRPLDCLRYIKRKFRRIVGEGIFELQKSILLEGLKDERRFPLQSSNLHFIITEIEKLEQKDLHGFEPYGGSWFRFFLDKENGIPLKDYTKAYLSVRGLLKTEKESVAEYLNNNKSIVLEILKSEAKIINELPQVEATIKPIFKAEAIDAILAILEGFFPTQKQQLRELLTDGVPPSEKLLFHGNGKTLLDFFKQLHFGHFITAVQQIKLEEWICVNFEYFNGDNNQVITPKYASKVISGSERPAKGNRLINVIEKDGSFKIVQLKFQNRENH